jgi:hypothetical protein
MPTEDDLRAALTSLERHAPDAARVLPGPGGSRPRPWPRSPQAAGWLAGIATAAAVAGTVTAVTVTAGTSGTPTNGRVASSAPITKATLQARLLAAFSGAVNEIAVEHATYKINNEVPTTDETWSYPVQPSAGQPVRVRETDIAQGGAFYEDDGESYLMPARQQASAGLRAEGEKITVSHSARVWWLEQGSSLYVTPPVGPTVIAKLPGLGKWTEHRTTLGGRPAIELTMKYRYPASSGGSLSDTLWVDATTYLPLRETFNDDSPGMDTIGTIYYEYRPATPANLALLTPPIPAGFRQVHPAAPPPGVAGPRPVAPNKPTVSVSPLP